MSLRQRIDKRLSQSGDSETIRARKQLALGMTAAGALIALLNTVMFAMAGYMLATWCSLVLTILLGLSAIVFLRKPDTFRWGGWYVLFVTVLFNFAGQILTGGLTSGTFVVVWSLVAILGAVLIFGWRTAAGTLVLLAVAMIVAALLTPLTAPLAAEASLPARLAIGTTNFIILAIYLAGSTLLLIRIIEALRARADDLLLNILPAPIAERLKNRPGTIADGYNEVSVLFADIIDFTNMSSGADPGDVVNLLNDIFSDFDDLAVQHGLEKIKTIGDEYMVAAGLPDPRPDHLEATAAFAVDMLAAIQRRRGLDGEPLGLRVGINCGPVVAGVIGRQKFSYDLWGDAVNIASRMESNGLINQIHVTQVVKERLAGRYEFEEREPMYVKGKGMMVTYLLKA